MHMINTFYPRPVLSWPLGIVLPVSVCPCVCLCINPELVHMQTHHLTVQTKTTKFGQHVGLIDLYLEGQV